MAKRVKFPLNMGNGIMVRTIEELKEHYNAEKLIEYFLNGKLLTWLKDRYYYEYAEQIEKLAEQSNKHSIVSGLNKIFSIKISESIDVEDIDIRREKLEILRTFTCDDIILKNVDIVAFTQWDLDDLIASGAEVIYLCGKIFNISNIALLNKHRFVGINNPIILPVMSGYILNSTEIVFENCEVTIIHNELPELKFDTIGAIKINLRSNNNGEESKIPT